MNNLDFFEFTTLATTKNDFLQDIIDVIALKFDNYFINGQKKRKPLRRKTMELIVYRAQRELGVYISLKQIKCLINPRKKYPYTAILIIETIYNMLKDPSCGDGWKKDLEMVLRKYRYETINYEKCMLGDLPQTFINHTLEFEGTKYEHIFREFVASRDYLYNRKEMNYTMDWHIEKNFEMDYFCQTDIPDIIKNDMDGRVYIR